MNKANEHLATWAQKLKLAAIHDREAIRLRNSAEQSRCKVRDPGGLRCTADVAIEPVHKHRHDRREVA